MGCPEGCCRLQHQPWLMGSIFSVMTSHPEEMNGNDSSVPGYAMRDIGTGEK